MIGRRLALAWAGIAWLIACGADAGYPGPRLAIPVEGPVDVNELLRLTRLHHGLNSRLYYEYSFRQTTGVEHLNSKGQVKRTESRVYRVIPTRDGTERHLLEKDGDDPPAAEIRKQERRNQKLQKRWERIRKKQEQRSGGAGSPPVTPSSAPPPPATTESAPASTATTSAPADRGAGASVTATDSSSSSAPTGSTLRTAAAVPPSTTPTAPPLLQRPACDPEHPETTATPPRPGVTRLYRPPPPSAPSAASRRERQTAGDYSVFEILSLTDYEYVGTCEWDDRIAHVVTFTPPDDFDPLNPVERIVTAMEGSILIDAREFQVVRIVGRTTGPLKWGAGMVALRSAKVAFEATKVNGEVWLPSMDFFDLETRVMFDRDHQRITNYYDQYQKVMVTSSEEVVGVIRESGS